MTIADLLQIIRKHLASAIISFVAVFAAVAAVAFIMPPKYTATAEVFATYAGQSGETQTTNDMSSGANYLNTQIKTYPELVKTEAVLQPVIKDLGLDMTTTDLAGVVTAANPTNTFMVDISAEVGDPQQAADIANSVAKNLADQHFFRPVQQLLFQRLSHQAHGSAEGSDSYRAELPRTFRCIWPWA